MNPTRPIQPEPEPDPEHAMQSTDAMFRSACFRWSFAALVLLVLLVDALRAAPARAWSWLNWRADCAWCRRRLHGNPLAYAVSHGICRSCARDIAISGGGQTQTQTQIRTSVEPPVAVRPAAAGIPSHNP